MAQPDRWHDLQSSPHERPTGVGRPRPVAALAGCRSSHEDDLIEACVSDRIVWVLPIPDSNRGKQEWIDASCAITWDWLELPVTREVDLDTTRIVEAWISQQRQPTSDEVAQGKHPSPPKELSSTFGQSKVGDWRLICRHPQRAQE